jgi:hypothetical protein
LPACELAVNVRVVEEEDGVKGCRRRPRHVANMILVMAADKNVNLIVRFLGNKANELWNLREKQMQNHYARYKAADKAVFH